MCSRSPGEICWWYSPLSQGLASLYDLRPVASFDMLPIASILFTRYVSPFEIRAVLALASANSPNPTPVLIDATGVL